MEMYTLVVLLWLGTAVLGYDRDKMATFPRGMMNFNTDMEMGVWYYQKSLLPCSWSGSRSFKDDTNYMHVEPGKDYIISTESWRSNGVCVSINSKVTPEPGGACTRIIKDPIGDVTSGKDIVIATDGGKTFIIYWGCTKTGVSGQCDNPWVDVATRKKYPSPGTMQIVEAILVHLWGLSFREMATTKHEHNV